METEAFMRETGFSDEARRAVRACRLSREEIKSLPQRSWLNETYTGDRPDYVLALFAHYLARYSEQAYSAKGLAREEWLDTMRDLAIWSSNLQSVGGECGVRETHWLAHLVRTEIFRLGRLQFIPRVAQAPVCFGGNEFPAGTPYAEVHIPQGGKLSVEAVNASFRRAGELFGSRFYSCESWLLSPKLKTLLSGGNIISFASRFTVTESDERDRSAERYVFGRIGDPQAYRAENEFARRVKELALRGVFVGSALGYCLA